MLACDWPERPGPECTYHWSAPPWHLLVTQTRVMTYNGDHISDIFSFLVSNYAHLCRTCYLWSANTWQGPSGSMTELKGLRESPEGKLVWSRYFIMRDTSEVDGIFCRISASCSVHMYSVQYTCTVATPARTGGWCHCLEWTGEDMVQTSESRPIRGQGWRQWANHSLGWREVGGPWCWGQCAVFTGQATPVPSSKLSKTLLSSLRDR